MKNEGVIFTYLLKVIIGLKEVEIIVSELASKDFDIPSTFSLARLHALLEERLVYLLLNDLSALWNILYRIDVNERKVKLLFELPDASMIAPALAELIITRLKEKAISRIKYSTE